MQIVIWDYAGNGEAWLKSILSPQVSVARVIVPEDDDQDRLVRDVDYDYLMIAENGLRELFESIVKGIGIPERKVIYIFDMDSWISHPEAGMLLFQEDCALYRQSVYLQTMYKRGCCTLVNIRELSYVGSSQDNVVLHWMYANQKNFAEDEINIFYRLAQKYYSIADEPGIFLDIGANIGTTSIYFKKYIQPKLSILAFEADPETYHFLKTNIILNNMEKQATLENIGLGEMEREVGFYRNSQNPGGNSMIKNYGEDVIHVRTIALDDYLNLHSVDGSKIKYMWIDVEGFEPLVLKGARNLLAAHSIPIFMEFNPHLWNAVGLFDEIMAILSGYCGKSGGYIVPREAIEGHEVLHHIEELRKYGFATKRVSGIEDIFLVKNQS